MRTAVFSVSMAVIAAFLVFTTITFAPREAAAKRAGKPCGLCHTHPPTLNDQGKAVKAKRNRLKNAN